MLSSGIRMEIRTSLKPFQSQGKFGLHFVPQRFDVYLL